MTAEKIDKIIADVTVQIKAARPKDGGIWRGELSSSAISTSVSIFALSRIDSAKYAEHIERGAEWLLSTMQPDGSWGDTVESPSNMTATLLSFASLYALGKAPDATKQYIVEHLGGISDKILVKGVLDYYGKDLTFSVPILVMCALAGIIKDWDKIPQFPFELTILPQRLFKFLQLPVVSYAIPALIAVGIVRFRRGKQGFLSPIREMFVPKCLEVLTSLQPQNGGFLEAAPLTAFVSMCMSEAGEREHIVTQRAAQFLIDTVRADGSWSIDTDLACWVTSLAAKALGDDIDKKEELIAAIRNNAFTYQHNFTGAQAGGWGWSDLPGAVPDADDTSGALVALYHLTNGEYCDEVGGGIEWLMALQNNDGGMPTFCKGWGKLPFDRSCGDISAHALLAMELWYDVLPSKIQTKCRRSINRLIDWMQHSQSAEGAWVPLWFGDQDAPKESSPVYGTATAVEYLTASKSKQAHSMARRGAEYLAKAQNADGGWGGQKGVESKITLTARALAALAATDDKQYRSAIERGFNYIYHIWEQGELSRREPIGLYFSRLWYSEEMYNLTFTLNALNKLKTIIK